MRSSMLSDEVGHRTKVEYLTRSIQIFLPKIMSKAYRLRALLIEQVEQIMEQVDILVLPTCPSGAPKLVLDPSMTGSEEEIEYLSYPMWRSADEVRSRLFGRTSYSTGFNLSNNPAISVPCGFTAEGLPIGMQIVGRRMDETTVLKVAHAYERHVPHNNRMPSLE